MEALFQVAFIKRDTFGAGSPVLLPILATWTQSVPCLAADPSDEGGLGHFFGLFYQLRYYVRLNEEHYLSLTTFGLYTSRTSC